MSERALLTGSATDQELGAFHPALRTWFEERFPLGPTEPQARAWPLIRAGADVLVASPTGTGKTLTGFMVAIDTALRRGAGGLAGPGTGPEVVYVSPLRALAADVQENLQLPLEGARAAGGSLGLCVPELTVAVRTGDTPASERALMRRHPPDLLVTTPESLYLLVTAASSRQWLSSVRTVIVDEVHTLARDKRGAHLSLTLERLERVVRAPRLQRIGLSATQRPLETIARLLVGAGGRPMPEIVDCGLRRDLDVAIELPDAELEAAASRQQLDDVLDRIAGHVREHRTTLVFVNTRKMAERVALQLSERLNGPSDGGAGAGATDLAVAAHHGSLSAARRRLVEA
ncbi:MAG: DEAD/DEAH box helicase, partial [Acidimicrobiales bacterium]